MTPGRISRIKGYVQRKLQESCEQKRGPDTKHRPDREDDLRAANDETEHVPDVGAERPPDPELANANRHAIRGDAVRAG